MGKGIFWGRPGAIVMSVSVRKMPVRIVVYPKDVQNITGRKERAARKVLQNIREVFGKQKDGFVTVKEFCAYTGIDEDIVKEFLLD